MRAALITEYRKLVSTRMWWVLAVVMAGYMLFLGAVMAFSLTFGADQAGSADIGTPALLDQAGVVTSVYTLAVALGYVFPVLVGAMSVTGEFRHQTITPTLLAEPRRTVVLGAKMLAGLPVGLVFGVLGTACTVAGGAAVFALMDADPMLTDPEVLRTIALSAVALTLWALVGVGFGSVLTNQVAAIVVLLAFTQFVEPILRVLLGLWESTAGISKFLPGAAGEAIAGGSLYASSGIAELLPSWQGAVVLLGYAVGFAAIGRLTRFRGDIG